MRENLVVIKSEDFLNKEKFTESVRKVFDIKEEVEIDAFERVDHELGCYPHLVMRDDIIEDDKEDCEGVALYHFRGYGYQIGGFNGNGDYGSVYSHIQREYELMPVEFRERIIDMHIKGTLTRNGSYQVKNKETLGGRVKRKDLTRVRFVYSDNANKLLDDYIAVEVEREKSYWGKPKFDEIGATERLMKIAEDASKRPARSNCFDKFAEDYNFRGKLVEVYETSYSPVRDGLYGIAIDEDLNLVYIDLRFDKPLMIEVPKQLTLNNLESLIMVMSTYITYCLGGCNNYACSTEL